MVMRLVVNLLSCSSFCPATVSTSFNTHTIRYAQNNNSKGVKKLENNRVKANTATLRKKQ